MGCASGAGALRHIATRLCIWATEINAQPLLPMCKEAADKVHELVRQAGKLFVDREEAKTNVEYGTGEV